MKEISSERPIEDSKLNNDQQDKIQPGPDPKHPYIRRRLACPCPAISAMINHSYLTPKDRKDTIPWYTMVWALITCYHFSFPFAIILVFFSNLRLRTPLGFSIEQLSTHALIEHDGSITRYDKDKGDNLNPSSKRINSFLDSIHYPTSYPLPEKSKMVTLEDYADRRIILERQITAYPPGQSKLHVHLLGIGEAILALTAFEDRSVALADAVICARSQWLRTWYEEERLPIDLGWKPRVTYRKISLHRVLWLMGQLYHRIKTKEPNV